MIRFPGGPNIPHSVGCNLLLPFPTHRIGPWYDLSLLRRWGLHSGTEHVELVATGCTDFSFNRWHVKVRPEL